MRNFRKYNTRRLLLYNTHYIKINNRELGEISGCVTACNRARIIWYEEDSLPVTYQFLNRFDKEKIPTGYNCRVGDMAWMLLFGGTVCYFFDGKQYSFRLEHKKFLYPYIQLAEHLRAASLLF